MAVVAVALVVLPTIALMGSGDAAGSTTLVDQQLDGIVAAGDAAPTVDPGLLPPPGSSVQPQVVQPTTALQVVDGAGGARPIAATAFVAGYSRGIPERVLAAYRHAADAEAVFDPGCGLPWWVLAGIGRIESGHAAGGHVDRDGTTIGRILGPRLDGSTPGTATVPDSDRGALDGDPLFDRAVGPMQFLPSTWAAVASDGNGDGRADPNNVFDASLGAARYLCAGGVHLTTDAALTTAVMRYNQSHSYVAEVLSWGHAYRDGVTLLADATGPIPTAPVTATRRSPVVEPVTAASTSTRGPAPTTGAVPPAPPRSSQPTAGPTSGPTSPAAPSTTTISPPVASTTTSSSCTPASTSPAPTSPTPAPTAPATAAPTSSTTAAPGTC